MLSNVDFELTLEQQFQMQVIEKELATMNQAKLKDLLLQTSRLLMIKENIICSLAKRAV
ncbi:NblA/ycf18 family protein [Phormidium sp. FACHB-592]|uniref:NblA/ycf18 family protein n=1 Tax=Stenomitos frigidus AS-A4 TaxID=2933935 RepID=A0ABV0KTP5_9CYAN|nr:NblA/ycf18 family protein [Phormidium sp. FACHB-592]MBD2075230.1 NblA/ycf18 family protein [Phormidium sp. FACHB-592]